MANNNTNAQKKLFVTPAGTVGAYPYLQKPDMGNAKFPKPRGEWSCKLIVPVAKAAALVSAISKASADNYKDYLDNVHPKALADAKRAGKRPPSPLSERDYPFYEDGEGNVVFTFKAHASYKDKATGEMKPITLRVYDSKGARIEAVPAISKGSELRAEFSVVPYQSPVAGCGVRLQLARVQLLKLVEYGSGSGDTFGEDFEYDGEGYTAPPVDEFKAANYAEEDVETSESAYAQYSNGDF